MRRRRGPLGGLLLVGLLGLAGCATAPARPPPVGLRIEEARALLLGWEVERQAFVGRRGAVELTVARRGRTDRVAAVLLVAPARLRIEVAAPFGLPVLVATVGPEEVVVYRPLDQSAFRGAASPAAVERWLGAAIDPEILIGLLVGQVPAPPSPEAVRVEGRGEATVMAWEQGPRRYRVSVSADGRPARLVLEDRERIVATFGWAMNQRLVSLEVLVPAQAARLNLRYLSAEDAALPADAFDLVLPPNVRVQSTE